MAKRKKFTETIAQELDNMPEVIKIETPVDIETREIEEEDTTVTKEPEPEPVVEEEVVEEVPEVKETKVVEKKSNLKNPRETLIYDKQTSTIAQNLWSIL